MGNTCTRTAKQQEYVVTATSGYYRTITDKESVESILHRYKDTFEMYNNIENKNEEILLDIEKIQNTIHLLNQLIELL